MTLDPRDALLQAHTPTIMVPRYGELAPLEKNGHRYLVAAHGLWLEVRRPWLHARVPIAFSPVLMPYGQPEQQIVYAFGEEALVQLQMHFLRSARIAMPNECAAWGVYDERTGTLGYWPLMSDAASPGSVTFHRPRLAEHEHLAVDLHSHGAGAAFFSEADDEDDAGEVKISVVVGTLDSEPTFATRLCLLGEFIE